MNGYYLLTGTPSPLTHIMSLKKTKVNGNLVLTEDSEGILFGTDSLLLADFVYKRSRATAVDLGTGSGVIALLLLSLNKAKHVVGVEIQERLATLAQLNARENGFEQSFGVINGDMKSIKELFDCGRADYVVTNPPYLKCDVGKKNISILKYNAFHESLCSIEDVCASASWCLKSGGDMFVVYRPERFASLLCAMRANGIEPKRIRAVCPVSCGAPSLFLVSGRKGASEGVRWEKPLNIYTDNSHRIYTDEMRQIFLEFD